jgi:hypothetical protein
MAPDFAPRCKLTTFGHRRGDNTPQPIRSLCDWPNRLATRDTCNGVGAKMGLEATKPLSAGGMNFKRLRVPGEEHVDVAALLAQQAAQIGAKQ